MSYKRIELEGLSKKEVVAIATRLNIPLRKSETKQSVVDAILRNQRAKARGLAFKNMM